MKHYRLLYVLVLILFSCSSDGDDKEDEDDDDYQDDQCESVSIEHTSDFNFAGSNGQLGVSGSFADVYFVDEGLILDVGVAGSNTLTATIELDIVAELNDENESFDLELYEGKLYSPSGTYSTLFNSSTITTGGYLVITSYDLECMIFSGEYDIIGGRYNSSVNADNFLRIIGSFNDITIDD